ncbi:hypothetical protein CPB83DRAFT_848844 [Crepidotus variabilis]|uniref:Beach-domain-containing protein n=1 Tax=Crepidotus variabilis TaxID=179855 RepID=A0A9P6ELZ8_9AGAR|nr:hypothetical protein CPB83DRAFT_848844 [Crepidotus variabilis]
MFQSLLSPIVSRFDRSTSNDPNDPTSPTNGNLTSPRGASLLSPRSPLAWGLTSPALSGFGGQGGIGNSPVGGNEIEDMANAEEFARDVLVELMRGAVEDIRVQSAGTGTGISWDDIRGQIKVLSEIHRIMQQDVSTMNASAALSMIAPQEEEARTKAVFREMDGFLCLMSVLAALSAVTTSERDTHEEEPSTTSDSVVLVKPTDPTEECIRWVFLVINEALEGCLSNEVYFRTKVGWEALADALRALSADSLGRPRRLVLSHLLALSLGDFDAFFDEFFVFAEPKGVENVDALVVTMKEKAGRSQGRLRVKHPGAMRILWEFVEKAGDQKTRYALYKALEVLYGVCHRNAGVLSSLSIVGDAFYRFGEVRAVLRTDPDNDEAKKDLEKEKQVLQKLLRKLLEMGATTTDARTIFHAAVLVEDANEKLDPEILDVVRFGMRSRWVEHFSFEGKASIVLHDDRWQAVPREGLSFMMWFNPSSMPSGDASYPLFSAVAVPRTISIHNHQESRVYLQLSLLVDGRLRMRSTGAADADATFATAPNARVKRGRWTHLTIVWYPRKGGHPNLRLYLDGAFVEGVHLAYPRAESLSGSAPVIQYKLGSDTTPSGESGITPISWSLASAYLLGLPVPDDIPRLIHHLGPRYTASFQDPGLVRFLTYEATTSLNMYLANVALAATSARSPGAPTGGSSRAAVPPTPILKALRDGMSSIGVYEDTIIFCLSPAGFDWGVASSDSSTQESVEPFRQSSSRRFSGSWDKNAAPSVRKTILQGDIFVVKTEGLDEALWKIGGVAVGLRLVELAETPHELSRTLAILTDALKNSWQNSEDMERLRGYDILAAILHRKAGLINLTSYETLFEFLGLNFNAPEQSTIVNPSAYRALALDFSLWAKTGAAISTGTPAIPPMTPSSSRILSPKPTLKLAASRTQIQQLHLEHFATLLLTSRYRVFNWKVGLGEAPVKSPKEKDGKDKDASGGGRATRGGVSLVRRLLFVLQIGWYGGGTKTLTDEGDEESMIPYVIDALGVALRAPGGFGKEDIKAVVAYLAANLHEPPSTRDAAEKVLELLVDLLSWGSSGLTSSPTQSQALPQTHYQKFNTCLPLNRILLLLLGERPSSTTATLILRLIALGITQTPNFNRKFELVGGWSMLKVVLPSPRVWDMDVNQAAWDVLLGRVDRAPGTVISGATTPTSAKTERHKLKHKQKSTEVTCPQILPTILSALRAGLMAVAERSYLHADGSQELGGQGWEIERTMERLVEELLNMHASSATFRHVFESQQTTQLFIDAYKAMTDTLSKQAVRAETIGSVNEWSVRIVEKLSHFGLALALDNAVGGSQKREILDIIQSGEAIINPGAATVIDPSLVVDNRTMRQRFASARFSIQVGERAVMKTISRTAEWRTTVKGSEKKRLRKMILDLRELRRQVSRLTEWSNLLSSERGLWPHQEDVLWRLDETEGPHRTRKKLQPEVDHSPSSRVDVLDEMIRDVRPPDTETNSVTQIDVPPWAEAYEITSTEMEDQQHLADDIVDDKLRRVRHELEPGDVIEAVATAARVDGVDSSPGLLILGRTHIYMLDGVVENDEGEVIEAKDAPKRLFFIPGSIVELNGPQRAQRWPHGQIATFSNKKFLFRDVALEIYFKDSRSLLLVFLDIKKRADFETRLSGVINRPQYEQSLTLRTPMLNKMSSRMFSGFRSDELSTATRKWQAREISNFAYLSILNQISGRTPSDATQYPVFPWVLSNYSSHILDLNEPKSYRDLTKPMGALTETRRQAAENRYTNLESVGEEPFHYGTHFSSSMIVCHFLIRLAPFTNMFKTLQGGDWDLPDRLFSDLARAYESAASDVRGDVRELIPEFFTTPEFLENAANHNFGILQQTGERIHDVKLPPWAHDDPLLFIVLNRRALESPIVSEQLPAWIDLIWGCKQRDQESLNAFHPLSYEGSIDLDSIKDDLEREATVGIIHNFGQTPRKLFTAPHPERYNHGLHTLPIGTLHGIEEDPHLLSQSSRCFKDLGVSSPIHNLIPDYTTDRASGKVIPCTEGVVCLPQYPSEFVEWRSRKTSPASSTGSTSSFMKFSNDLRVVVDNTKVVQIIENAFVTCAAFADAGCLVTGGSDYTVRLWRVWRAGQQYANNNAHGGGSSSSSGAGAAASLANGTGMRLTLSNIMRVHTDEVVSVSASRQWSMVVSGSKDGSAAIWDLNRGVYVRSIWHCDEEDMKAKRSGVSQKEREMMAVNLVAVNESTGYIATCSRLKLLLHTINGRPIASLDLTSTSSFSALVPTITSLAFHEREYSHLGILATGGPDGNITLRTWTADGTEEGKKAQWEFLQVRVMKVKLVHGATRPPAVTALRFVGETLYHGEETGKAYTWTLPDT